MKRKLIIMVSLVLLAASTIYALHINSDVPNRQKNGFNRQFIPNALVKLQEADLESEPKKILGATAHHIYFEDSKPGRLLRTDHQLRNHVYLEMDFSTLEDGNIEDLYIESADYPNVYVFPKNKAAIYRYTLPSGQITQYPTGEIFSKGIPISPHSYILRVPTADLQDYQLKKLTFMEDEASIANGNVFGKEGDGGFSSEGMLYYDVSTGMICYSYHYQNGFLVMDTNLTVIRQVRTIDTTTVPQVYGKKINTQKGFTFTLSSVPKFINLRGCIANGRLFLRSNLKADNEKMSAFRDNSVFDVYDLASGRYLGSFYLPGHRGERANGFLIYENNLVAIYEKYLATYKLDTRWALVSGRGSLQRLYCAITQAKPKTCINE